MDHSAHGGHGRQQAAPVRVADARFPGMAGFADGAPRMGEAVTLGIDMAHASLFDPTTLEADNAERRAAGLEPVQELEQLARRCHGAFPRRASARFVTGFTYPPHSTIALLR